MITTIDHTHLTIEEINQALGVFGPVALQIEQAVGMRRHQLTLSISKANVVFEGGLMERELPLLELYLVKPCEIISFESEASVASQIIAKYTDSFAVNFEGEIIRVRQSKPNTKTSAKRIIPGSVKFFKEKIGH